MADRALIRFRWYESAARDMERRKRALGGRLSRAWDSAALVRDEEELDRAWDEAVHISEGYSPWRAEAIVHHFLFLEPWADVAAELDISIDRLKKEVYKALAWLDEHPAAGTPGGGDGA